LIKTRHGTSIAEVWNEGQVFKQTQKKLQNLLEEREEIEKKRKDLSKKIKKKTGSTGKKKNSS
jgi:hypothetical protein